MTDTKSEEKNYRFRIDSSASDERLDVFLTDQFDSLSRSYIQKLSKEGNVLVNEKAVKCGYSLRENDVVSIAIPDMITPDIEPENIPLDILYEDEDLLVVNKPKGMVVHPAAGHYSGTLVNALMYHCKDSLSGINGVMRPGIVHRIDRDTSGSLIVCKNDAAHNSIAAQLKEHSAKRIYKGIVCGHLKEEKGVIDAPIGRDKSDRKKMSVYPAGSVNIPGGGTVKNAVTHYTLIEPLNKNYDYVSFRLETGRTHQIRVHMASINRPLLGDLIYGHDDSFHTNGQVLHAEVIGFIHPRTGEYMEFAAPMPDYFTSLLNKLR
ncbi:MAG: RluA family pseudouridine synthase [Lachnospiraceae bacterium]|nr:RluA family pseudouridine synthase [Lachnospiraceae bacterium]